ncbi:prolipoprotein diacylglyceryl transferase [Mycoplasma sp. M5725]|uniref:Phosphatidylglycerol--prolipoprotein diacylglyceryl transferase n=1 Tax=Mycoplasma phocimorsus TaxID=3045839 RepID=A0AAJ1PTM8_9MOLU|nr:prolipoprotein diacylglyceryl transferase [Mycoplasma phocimorsus]MDJ1645636.1 prolipoprotein diacylglyceryl transferase [Mycoplasma phocimorsus]
MHNTIGLGKFEYGSSGLSVLFSIGNFTIATYSMTILLGMLCSILTIAIFWKREGYKFETLLTLIVITLPTSIIGARALFVIERTIYGDYSIWQNWSWIKIWEGGLSIHGGIILAVIADLIYARKKRYEIDIRVGMSLIIPNILIGQVIGRFGNYANHEVYGSVIWDGSTINTWIESFARNMFISDSYSDALGFAGLYRQPLFLYEVLLSLAGWIILVWICNGMRLLKPGSTAGLYFFWYGSVRMIMEPLRQESYELYGVISTLFMVFGILMFVYFEFISDRYIRVWDKSKLRFNFIRKENANV